MLLASCFLGPRPEPEVFGDREPGRGCQMEAPCHDLKGVLPSGPSHRTSRQVLPLCLRLRCLGGHFGNGRRRRRIIYNSGGGGGREGAPRWVERGPWMLSLAT